MNSFCKDDAKKLNPCPRNKEEKNNHDHDINGLPCVFLSSLLFVTEYNIASKMRVLIVALCIVGHALAHTHEEEMNAKVIRSEYTQEPDGSYHWVMETDTGIVSEARGKFEKTPDGNLTAIVEGSNSYVDPDGKAMKLTYTADAEGYHPSGDMLPTPPPTMPIPDYIQRALDYTASKNKTQSP